MGHRSTFNPKSEVRSDHGARGLKVKARLRVGRVLDSHYHHGPFPDELGSPCMHMITYAQSYGF
jgi:hypothetical protein